MQVDHSAIGDRAFGDDNEVVVSYTSYQDALDYIQTALQGLPGAGLLQGPGGSGKSTILRSIATQLSDGAAVAFVDGTRLKSRDFLSQALAGFGHDLQFESSDELFRKMIAFVSREARSAEAPMLIVDNVDQMYPSALATLNDLAELKLRSHFALRILVAGRIDIDSLLGSGSIGSLEKRCSAGFLLHPMTHKEALVYLHSRLSGCGVNDADTIFPMDVCERLYQQSGGWPGSLNRQAAAALKRSGTLPVSVDDTRTIRSVRRLRKQSQGAKRKSAPSLVVSKAGKKLADISLAQNKTLIGRSDFADVVIADYFVSKMHAAILAFSDALILMDLNSANGTCVNSVPVSCTLLREDDIVSIGSYRLKIQDAPPIGRELEEALDAPDTIRMKTLEDLRRVRARRRARATKRGAGRSPA